MCLLAQVKLVQFSEGAHDSKQIKHLAMTEMEITWGAGHTTWFQEGKGEGDVQEEGGGSWRLVYVKLAIVADPVCE